MKKFRVMMILGCPPLNERRTVAANYEPLPEAEAQELFRQLEECVGVWGIGVDSLQLVGVELCEVA